MDYAETMRYFILIGLWFFSLAVVAQQVYRSVDAEGNVIFSDEETEGAEEVVIPETQTLPPLSDGNFKYTPAKEPKKEEYTVLEIVSPGNDQAIRENSGNITVKVSVSPRLVRSDKLVLYMDGKEVGVSSGTSFSLTNVDRGTHTLRAVIKGPEDRIRKSSASVTFHMLRYFNKPGS